MRESQYGWMATGDGVEEGGFLRSRLSVGRRPSTVFEVKQSLMPWTTQIQETSYPTTEWRILRRKRWVRGTWRYRYVEGMQYRTPEEKGRSKTWALGEVNRPTTVGLSVHPLMTNQGWVSEYGYATRCSYQGVESSSLKPVVVASSLSSMTFAHRPYRPRPLPTHPPLSAGADPCSADVHAVFSDARKD